MTEDAPRLPVPGPVALFGSGETSHFAGPVFEALLRRAASADPPRAAVLETPAGFEPNSAQVAGSVADYLRRRLGNLHPQVDVVAARRRGTPFSPDDPALAWPLFRANLIFLGAGSPTYAVRQLRDSVAWHALMARHRLGAAAAFASAGMVAAGAFVLPVYEIFKAGEELHWREGLDFFAPYGLSPAFVPHWNNDDGGDRVDTSRCYMGRERFAGLHAMLPAGTPVVGIDENTALLLDLSAGEGEVMGQGNVTVVREGRESRFGAAERFDMSLLGPFERDAGRKGIPVATWDAAVAALAAGGQPVAPPEARALAAEREAARALGRWAQADELRQRVATMGWRIVDAPSGHILEREAAGAGVARPAGDEGAK